MKIKRMMGFLATGIFIQFAFTMSIPADVIIGNLPGNDGTSTFINAPLGGSNGGTLWNSKAAGFDMPAGVDYRLDNVQLRLEFFSIDFALAAPVVTIYDDLAGTPNAPLFTLDNPVFGPGINTYSFTPGANFDLLSSATYWIVVTNNSAVANSFRWMASSPGLPPVGIATSAGYLFDVGAAPPTTASNTLNSYAVNATPIPEPSSLAIFGIGSVLICFRRRRHEMK